MDKSDLLPGWQTAITSLSSSACRHQLVVQSGSKPAVVSQLELLLLDHLDDHGKPSLPYVTELFLVRKFAH